jgi:hypothetical protein
MTEDLEFNLSPADAFHLDVGLNHIGCLLFLEKRIEPEAFQAFAHDFVESSSRLSASLDVKRRVWRKRQDFQLKDQLIVAPLSASETAILDTFALHYCNPLLAPGPPWRIVNMPFVGEKGEDRSAIGFLAHHAFLDGVRAFEVLRNTFASISRSSEQSYPSRPSITFKGWIQALITSAGELTGRPARAVTKGDDSGQRRFEASWVGRDVLRRAQRHLGIPRTEVLANAFASALLDRSVAINDVRLMIPRDLGGIPRTGGNRFLPIVTSFQRRDGSVSAEGYPDEQQLGALTALNNLRLRAMRWLPPPFARIGYHRWADGFDALCTILPHGLSGAKLAGVSVKRIIGVAPLIWRQPISATFVTGAAGADLLFAWDPSRMNATGLAADVVKHATALAHLC